MTRINVKLDDHKLADGNIDWSAYRLAQKASGEICTKCGGYVSIFGGNGHPDQCASCKSLTESSEEVTHSDIIRCPACGHEMSVSDFDGGELYEDGEHDVSCGECDEEFTVTTSVSYSFESPARVAEKKPCKSVGGSPATSSPSASSPTTPRPKL